MEGGDAEVPELDEDELAAQVREAMRRETFWSDGGASIWIDGRVEAYMRTTSGALTLPGFGAPAASTQVVALRRRVRNQYMEQYKAARTARDKIIANERAFGRKQRDKISAERMNALIRGNRYLRSLFARLDTVGTIVVAIVAIVLIAIIVYVLLPYVRLSPLLSNYTDAFGRAGTGVLPPSMMVLIAAGQPFVVGEAVKSESVRNGYVELRPLFGPFSNRANVSLDLLGRRMGEIGECGCPAYLGLPIPGAHVGGEPVFFPKIEPLKPAQRSRITDVFSPDGVAVDLPLSVVVRFVTPDGRSRTAKYEKADALCVQRCVTVASYHPQKEA